MSKRVNEPTCHHFCNTLNCPTCIQKFYKWAESHTLGKGKRHKGPATAQTFYEAAAKKGP